MDNQSYGETSLDMCRTLTFGVSRGSDPREALAGLAGNFSRPRVPSAGRNRTLEVILHCHQNKESQSVGREIALWRSRAAPREVGAIIKIAV